MTSTITPVGGAAEPRTAQRAIGRIKQIDHAHAEPAARMA